ncbi:hypothetical protein O1611_g2221 [Lasiodiplodia mahajangana]|uniref:Uncharacterized protein n=1 Tax=Lasiodiplodia mahajangana TaxID=1108764 RepID=A0ACC2JVH1_9PEZI|nr:hypothetical protein O1611_g2221 [Lasiodiplodia mahajangana]
MGLLPVFFAKGWQRTGTVNVILTFLCDVVLLILLSISVSQPNASLSGSTIIFSGDCNLSTTLNLILHLLANVISGVILASSNFFMQVLNSPSRGEIDKAHKWLRSVDIGVPSFKNLQHISYFKLTGWVIFLVSSIPIHLFFNSAIFHTAYEGSQWHLTIATEAFIKGAPYFPPARNLVKSVNQAQNGLNLAPAGAAGPRYKWSQSQEAYEQPNNSVIYYSDPNGPNGEFFNGYGDNPGIVGYGEPVPWDHYLNTSSTVHRNISLVAAKAGGWDVLNATSCQIEYLSCKPRTEYEDVLVIIDLEGSVGWTRSEVFDLGSDTNLTSYLDAVSPSGKVNSLWFSAQCTTTREPVSRQAACTNTCNGALGKNYSAFPVTDALPIQELWLLVFFPPVRLHDPSLFGEGIVFNETYNSLLVDYCLARPANPPICKVGVSNLLLLVVILSILLKAIQGTIVVWKLPSESLVTPGDAIQSFISNPDLCTQGLGTLHINDSWELEYGFRRHWVRDTTCEITTSTQPRRWTRKQPRLFSVINNKNWIQTYRFLLANLALLLFGLIYSLVDSRDDISFPLDYSNGFSPLFVASGLPFIGTLLVANTPQLIFSTCYSVYNAMVTHLQVEKEWNSFSQFYQPLRVSNPSGKQVSTYRLQLPYSLSVPLIGVSIAFHWLASSAIFLYVADGGYLEGRAYSQDLRSVFHVSDSSLITLGYSTGFILLITILYIVLIICPPLLLGIERLKGDMVGGGSNSLVISAACHVTNVDVAERDSGLTEENQSNSSTDMLLPRSQHLDSSSAENATNEERATSLPLSQRKLRWGAMLLPPEVLSQGALEDGRMVSHLGFGGEEHNVTPPREGNYYI